MKRTIVFTLALTLMVGAALARPNLVEPIYLRRRSNPLEIVEESIETSTASLDASSSSSSTEQDGGSAAHPGTIAAGSTGSSERTTHQPRYRTTNEGPSRVSLIKDFLLKNLANLQEQRPPSRPPPPPPSPDEESEEQNTLRSVSSLGPGLGYPMGNWVPPPEKTSYVYPVKTGTTTYAGQKRKPVIHKIITKWSDRPAEVFGGGEYRPTTPLSGGYTVPPIYTSSSVQQSSDEAYQQQQGSPAMIHLSSSSGTKDNKQHNKKKKNKIKIIVVGPGPGPGSGTGGQKVQKVPSDPDRPDAMYSGEQDPYGQQPASWDPYDDVAADANPYDDSGDLKGESVSDLGGDPECTEINISVNGKQGCNEIQIAINDEVNPSPTRVGELTKLGPTGAPLAAAAVLPAVGAAGAAGLAGAAPSLVAADLPLAVPLSAAPLAASPVASVVPVGLPAPVTSFLNTPISSLVSNIIRPPVRIGQAGNLASPLGNGVSGTNSNKNKLKPGKPSHDHGITSAFGSLVPDVSHALLGMLAAVSAMTPMNMFVLGLTSMPVLAMFFGTVAVGMYAYKLYYPSVGVKHVATTVVVHKKPQWTRRPPWSPFRRPSPHPWVDFDYNHSPHLIAAWDNDRRSFPGMMDPYRRQRRPKGGR